jgi:hypothetical protein
VRSGGGSMSIQMPKLVQVICDECDYRDQAYWSQFGAQQPCLMCDAAPVYLSKVSA